MPRPVGSKNHNHSEYQANCSMCDERSLVRVKVGRKKELGKPVDNAASLVRRHKMSQILAYISDSGSIGSAAAKLGIKPSTIRYWVEHDPIFAKKYEDAQLKYLGRLEDALNTRAIEGVDKTIVSAGKYIATDKVYSDSLLLAALKANDPKKYREKGREIGAEMGVDKDGNKYFKVYEGFKPDDV